jgi:kinetochore protein Spc24
MASSPSSPFSECHELIEEMRRIYSTDEDATKVHALNQQFAGVRERCEQREDKMQAVIKELTRRVSVAQAAATPTEPDDAHDNRLKQVEAERLAAGEYLTSMEHEAQSLEQMQVELRARGASLKVKRQEIDAMAMEEVPRTKHELSLYAHISKISWHYEATDRIRGRVNAHENKEVHPIDFALGDVSEYQLANDLWNIID